MDTKERKQTWAHDDSHGIPEVELSTNPILRVVFEPEIDNSIGARVRYLTEEQVRHEVIPPSLDQEISASMMISKAVERALLFVVLVQVPAGLLSFFVSPTVEWEIIGGSLAAMLILKLVAAATRSSVAVIIGALAANVCMGALTGEVLHFVAEATLWVVDTPHVVGSLLALLFAVTFYGGLICDVAFLKDASKVKISVRESSVDGTVIITESPILLTPRQAWWVTWGLSAGSVWSPIHALYLMCRLVDWLTAGVLVDLVCHLIFLRSPRRHR